MLQDRAFSGEATPDAHFVTRSSDGKQIVRTSHEVIRYAVQRGPGNPVVYFQDLAMRSLVFYFEDLTSLSDLYRATGCDVPFDYPIAGNPGAVAMGPATHWFQAAAAPDGSRLDPKPFEPKVEVYSEFGYRRPRAYRLRKGEQLVLGDTYLYLRPVSENENKIDNASVCRNYVEMLADVYQHIRKPPQIATDWRRDVVPQLVRDVQRPENTTRFRGEFTIPKAYVGYEHDDTQLWTVLNLLHPLELYTKQVSGGQGGGRITRPARRGVACLLGQTTPLVRQQPGAVQPGHVLHYRLHRDPGAHDGGPGPAGPSRGEGHAAGRPRSLSRDGPPVRLRLRRRMAPRFLQAERLLPVRRHRRVRLPDDGLSQAQ